MPQSLRVLRFIVITIIIQKIRRTFMLRCVYTFAVLVALLILSACSTASVRVMPGEDGTNRVVSKDIEQEGAEEAAVKAANEFCEKRNQTAVLDRKSTRLNSVTFRSRMP